MPAINPPEMLNVRLPVDLRKRAQRVAKHFKTSETEILRTGFREQIDLLEKKMDEEETREALRKQRSGGRFAMGGSMKTLTRAAASAPAPVSQRMAPTRVDALYETQAKLIAEAKDSEVDRAVAFAIKAIRREAPLTSGSDEKIVERLEVLVKKARDVKQREEASKIVSQLSGILRGAPPERAEDALVGKEVDFDDDVADDE